MQKVTEQNSLYQNLDKMTTQELLTAINTEDKKVAFAVEKSKQQIEKCIDAIFLKLKEKGRLFYIGAGTSGRLGVVDASECPPTFGVDYNKVIGLIAGGDQAIRKAVEFAEDDTQQAWVDLKKFNITSKDFVVGIAASGTTPYVVGGLQKCQENNIQTACIVCNTDSPISKYADFPIEVIVGAEFVTGSSRMKAGTAQKMVLNMISTSVMIKLGHVKGNKMVDMQLSNDKLVARGTQMIVDETHIAPQLAQQYLLEQGSVRKAIDFIHKNKG